MAIMLVLTLPVVVAGAAAPVVLPAGVAASEVVTPAMQTVQKGVLPQWLKI